MNDEMRELIIRENAMEIKRDKLYDIVNEIEDVGMKSIAHASKGSTCPNNQHESEMKFQYAISNAIKEIDFELSL